MKTPQRVIVMGASSGIGMQVARIFIAMGCRVGVAARRLEPLLQLQALAADRVVVAPIDVTAPQAPQLLRQLIGQLGGVDIYVHSTGIGFQNRTLDPGVEAATVDTNVAGFTAMVDAVFSHMATHAGGHITAISSIAGTRGLGPAPSYSASKAYQNCYLTALSQQARQRGLPITITDARPGFVDTPLLAGEQRYPMMLSAEKVARSIVRATLRRQAVVTIDWRYRVLVALWKLLPGCIWRRVRL